MNDYLQTTSGDLDLSTGDLSLTESTKQHQRDLLLSDKGHIRHKPEAGVGAVNYMYDNDPSALLRAARMEFAADGMAVKKIAYNGYNNDMEIHADYETD